MHEPLATELSLNTSRLISALGQFDFKTFNEKPGPQSWSAGEIAEHLLLFDQRTANVLTGKQGSESREDDSVFNAITTRLQDRSNRIDAPEALLPSPAAKEPEMLLEQLRHERDRLIRLIDTMDVNTVLPETPHRLFGPLTAAEWIRLTILHTERHLVQLGQLGSDQRNKDQTT
jgi:hypothetical protein